MLFRARHDDRLFAADQTGPALSEIPAPYEPAFSLSPIGPSGPPFSSAAHGRAQWGTEHAHGGCMVCDHGWGPPAPSLGGPCSAPPVCTNCQSVLKASLPVRAAFADHRSILSTNGREGAAAAPSDGDDACMGGFFFAQAGCWAWNGPDVSCRRPDERPLDRRGLALFWVLCRKVVQAGGLLRAAEGVALFSGWRDGVDDRIA